ncbi:MAG: 30S ribosomal protein S8 [Methylacidiphilales bacterium]|nr:30S ribosomal protein S8 [Candidatus Methylacidiphilales bacterium]
MSLTDPIAQLCTVIRNAQHAGLKSVTVPFSNVKEKIVSLLAKELYIEKFEIIDSEIVSKKSILIILKYYEGKAVIKKIRRVSKPGLRVYTTYETMPKSLGGVGMYLISTSRGIMTDAEAKEHKLGGELLCEVV